MSADIGRSVPRGAVQRDAELENCLDSLTRGSVNVDTDGARFVSLAGVRETALLLRLSPRQTAVRLLEADIWPEVFRRSRGTRTAGDIIRLLSSGVLVLGAGGLGGLLVQLLARLGVGRLVIVDGDRFEESNLNRQILCSREVLGRSKASVAASTVAGIAPFTEVSAVNAFADEASLDACLGGNSLEGTAFSGFFEKDGPPDAVCDCLDQLALEIRLERVCAKHNVPFVHGDILRDEGWALCSLPGQTRLGDLYGGKSPKGGTGSVTALAPALVATLMASLAEQVLLGSAQDLQDLPLLHVDASLPLVERFER
ncbi:MAG: ThiF family adenylyltransferase [Desulfovibrio sp.]|nr:ThiF family adenylyltransferase [Desulfovibrio sp.]